MGVFLQTYFTQVPSTLSASFKILWCAIVPVQARRPFQPFQSNSWDCTRMGQSNMIVTVQTTPAEQQNSPGTPVHKVLLPAAMMCTWNQTPREILRDRSCSGKALCHLLRSHQQLGHFFTTDYTWFVICLLVPNHIRRSLGMLAPGAGHLEEQGERES